MLEKGIEFNNDKDEDDEDYGDGEIDLWWIELIYLVNLKYC